MNSMVLFEERTSKRDTIFQRPFSRLVSLMTSTLLRAALEPWRKRTPNWRLKWSWSAYKWVRQKPSTWKEKAIKHGNLCFPLSINSKWKEIQRRFLTGVHAFFELRRTLRSIRVRFQRKRSQPKRRYSDFGRSVAQAMGKCGRREMPSGYQIPISFIRVSARYIRKGIHRRTKSIIMLLGGMQPSELMLISKTQNNELNTENIDGAELLSMQ